MTDAALRAKLYARAGRGAELGLERMRHALDSLGDPQRALGCVHVAGTNGKGSVCAMVEAIARAAGLRTGLYTSPHLQRLNERVRIDGVPIDDARLDRALARVLDERLELTFFEAMTAAAFVIMAEAEVELCIVEVGLGGRLDATNVIEAPLATAVTGIGRDHTRYLGEDLPQIAREKGAIAKPGAPLVLGAMPAEAEGAIRGLATFATPIWRATVGDDGDVRAVAVGDEVTITGPGGRSLSTRLALAGKHQLGNAAVATALAWQLEPRWQLGRAIAAGLGRARWPGRLERLVQASGVEVILDCAHNPDGARALAAALPAASVLVFGAMDDKAWREMLATLAPLAPRRIYAPIGVDSLTGRRAVVPATLAAAFAGETAGSPEEALALALGGARPGDRVLVTGSIYLVGAVRALLLGEARDPAVPL